MDATDMGSDLQQVLITEEQIGQRLDEMAAQIDADYAGRDPLLVGVLKGAVYVMADLSRRLHMSAPMDWMAVSSYGSGTKSSGVVRILKDLDTDVTDRHILIVEDVIDSGLTLSWLVGNLSSRGAASVEIATLLRKPVNLDATWGSDGKITGCGAWAPSSDGGQGAPELRSSPFSRWSESRTLR